MDRIGESLRAAGYAPAPGEVHLGDDAAILHPPAGDVDLVFCTDAAVAGVHADLSLLSPADLGWRATVATISDLAAMGAEPWRLVVSVCASPEAGAEEMMEGVIEASARFGCTVVGGDVTSSATATVVVAAIGVVPRGEALRRAGGVAGDELFVTGPLGASAAGLRLLRSGLPDVDKELVMAHRRPLPRIEAGRAALRAGASAAIDVSDGLGRDLDRLATASGLGVELDELPAATGATEAEALGGGEEYELILATPSSGALLERFAAEGLPAPIRIGRLSADARRRTLRGMDFEPLGFRHNLV